jgi:hypothetical protein
LELGGAWAVQATLTILLQMIYEHQYYQFQTGDRSVPYVTYNQVELAHSKKDFENFKEWMRGQTGLLLEGNEFGIYSWDYERWLRQNRQRSQRSGDWD